MKINFKSNGDGTCSVCGIIGCRYHDTDIVIPAVSPDGYKVTSINTATSVTIPEGVTSIGGDAFYCCTSLTSVKIPNGVTRIGVGAFGCCRSLTNVTIPEGVTNVDCRTFYGCRSLTSVTLPEGVVNIGDSAFELCNSLTSIMIPKSVKRIGDHAFSRCHSLTSLMIPESVTIIDSHAFGHCSSLKKGGRFKATNGRMMCRRFQFKIGKDYECDGEPELCSNGFHFVENAFDLFNYYSGEIGRDIRVFDVACEGVSDETEDDSKRVCKKIRLVREYKSFAELLN